MTIKGLSAVALVAATIAGLPGHAQAPVPETWGEDGCLYVAIGPVWSNTMWCRSFRDDENTDAWDLSSAQGIPIYRFSFEDPGWVRMYQHHSGLTYLVPDRNSVWVAMASVRDFDSMLVQWSGDQWLSPLNMSAMELQQFTAAMRKGNAELRTMGPECLRWTDTSTIRHAIPTTAECQTEAERERMYELASGQAGISSQGQREASRLACQSELNGGAYDATGQRRPGAYDASGASILPPATCQ